MFAKMWKIPAAAIINLMGGIVKFYLGNECWKFKVVLNHLPPF